VKVTILGAGLRTPQILRGLIGEQDRLALEDVVIHDTDPERLHAMATFAGHVSHRWGGRFAVRADPDPHRALTGAAYVLTAIRVGGEEGRVKDERVPLMHGVVGQETIGPGGFAMAMRTIPVMLDYARLIADAAPDAWVINLTNPVGIITQALSDHTRLRVVGVCDTPVEMKRSLARFLRVHPDRMSLDYFGLNHLGWARRILVDGRDQMPIILERYEELQMAEPAWRLFDPELVRSLEMLPNEYLYFFYNRERAFEHLIAGETRGEQLLTLNRTLWSTLRETLARGEIEAALAAYTATFGTRTASYMAQESGGIVTHDVPDDGGMFEGEGYGGLASAVVSSLETQRDVPLILNIPNRGSIVGLRNEDVVEVPSSTNGGRPIPHAVGDIPDAAMALVAPVKTYERLCVDAAVTGSPASAVRALTAHPLVGSVDLARALLDGYAKAHGGALSSFGGHPDGPLERREGHRLRGTA
jgi:alpha-galactosidase/6-phospho-beta-glucosidase family protein